MNSVSVRRPSLILKPSGRCRIHEFSSTPWMRSQFQHPPPLLHYPDFRVCWEATDWLIDLWRRGCKPDTISTYAHKISPFIRYLHINQLSFSDSTDRVLNSFSAYLLESEEKSPNNVRMIIHRTLDLLSWLQNEKRLDDQVFGVDDPTARVRCYTRSLSYRRKNGSLGSRSYIHHESIPARTTQTTRSAIADRTIDQLWEATDTFPTSFRRNRAKSILILLENSGIRRSELINIGISDIDNASESGTLMIRSAKARISNHQRTIPIDNSALDRVRVFIDSDRKAVIEKSISTGAIERDTGFVFISCFGRPLSTQTISDEIATLRRTSGTEEPAHAHLFRHRYVTRLIERIHLVIRDLGVNDLSDSMRHKVMSLMGWSSPDMVQVYNDKFLDEAEGWSLIQSKFQALLEDSNASREIVDLLRDLEGREGVDDHTAPRVLSLLRKLSGREQ